MQLVVLRPLLFFALVAVHMYCTAYAIHMHMMHPEMSQYSNAVACTVIWQTCSALHAAFCKKNDAPHLT